MDVRKPARWISEYLVTTVLDEWFISHVLPLEGLIHAFLRRHGHEDSEIPDLRQEAYARIYGAARRGVPAQAKPFVMTAVRNLLIDHIRRSRIVSIEAMADVEQMMQADELTPERHLGARDELRRLQQGLQTLPVKCRQVVELRKIYGLSQREVARRLGIAEDTVERQTLLGMRALADFMLGGTGKIQRPARRFDKKRLLP